MGNGFIHYVGIALGGLDIGMPHELLQHPYIDPVFEHGGGETVPQRMAGDPLFDTCRLRGPLNGLLQTGFHDMVPPLAA